MPVTDECFDCLLSRVAHTCGITGHRDDEARVVEICAARLSEMRDLPVPQPVIASALHRLAVRELRATDPYAEIKAASTVTVHAACGTVLPRLSTFRDFATAAIIGNTFDHGVKGHTIAEDFSAFFSVEFDRGLAIDDCDEIERLCRHVVYITDNCGELVLDRLLIGFLDRGGADVTVAVRDGPILNDATLEDARALGLDALAGCLTTTGGGSEIGVRLECIPAPLERAIGRADVIIAKGMANYESLSEYADLPPVAFMLAAKCRPIAARLGVAVGEKVALLRE